MDEFSGLRVLALESRRSAELAKLITSHVPILKSIVYSLYFETGASFAKHPVGESHPLATLRPWLRLRARRSAITVRICSFVADCKRL